MDAMEAESEHRPGLGYSLDSRTVEMICAIKLRVQEDELASNACTIQDVWRLDRPLTSYPDKEKP